MRASSFLAGDTQLAEFAMAVTGTLIVTAPTSDGDTSGPRDRGQQIAAGELRRIAVVEPGEPLADPEQSRRAAVPGRLQGLGDPGLGFICLPDQPVGRLDSRIAVAPVAPAFLDPIDAVVEFDLDGDGWIAADVRREAPDFPVPRRPRLEEDRVQRIEDGRLAVLVRRREHVQSVADAADLDGIDEAPDILQADRSELHRASSVT